MATKPSTPPLRDTDYTSPTWQRWAARQQSTLPGTFTAAEVADQTKVLMRVLQSRARGKDNGNTR